jgi:hypothetical protein
MSHVACSRSNTASLDVLITDENDNAPEFLQQIYSGGELQLSKMCITIQYYYHDNLSEVSSTAPPDTSILSVRAMDDDRSPEFSTVCG